MSQTLQEDTTLLPISNKPSYSNLIKYAFPKLPASVQSLPSTSSVILHHSKTNNCLELQNDSHLGEMKTTSQISQKHFKWEVNRERLELLLFLLCFFFFRSSDFFLFFKFIYLFLFSYSCLHFLPFPPPQTASPTSLPYLYPPP